MYAKSVESQHFNTSAKTGIGVSDIFMNLATSKNLCLMILLIEVIEFQNSRKDDAPKKKMNTRGVLKVDGYSDFNPEANIQVTRKSASVKNAKD